MITWTLLTFCGKNELTQQILYLKQHAFAKSFSAEVDDLHLAQLSIT